jgi:hypothetical protein
VSRLYPVSLFLARRSKTVAARAYSCVVRGVATRASTNNKDAVLGPVVEPRTWFDHSTAASRFKPVVVHAERGTTIPMRQAEPPPALPAVRGNPARREGPREI